MKVYEVKAECLGCESSGVQEWRGENGRLYYMAPGINKVNRVSKGQKWLLRWMRSISDGCFLWYPVRQLEDGEWTGVLNQPAVLESIRIYKDDTRQHWVCDDGRVVSLDKVHGGSPDAVVGTRARLVLRPDPITRSGMNWFVEPVTG